MREEGEGEGLRGWIGREMQRQGAGGEGGREGRKRERE